MDPLSTISSELFSERQPSRFPCVLRVGGEFKGNGSNSENGAINAFVGQIVGYSAPKVHQNIDGKSAIPRAGFEASTSERIYKSTAG